MSKHEDTGSEREPGATPAAPEIKSESKSDLPAVDSPPLSPAAEPVPAQPPSAQTKTDEVKIEPPAPPAIEAPKVAELKADAPAATVTPLRAHWSLKPRQKRRALLAASVVLAAGLGGVIGALAAGGWSSRTDVAALNERKALQHSIDQLHKQVATLKGNLDKANKAVAEKTALEKAALDKANKIAAEKATLEKANKVAAEKAALEKSAKLAPPQHAHNQIAKIPERFESAGDPDFTGSIPSREAVPLPVPRPAPQIGVAETRPVVLQDWTIHGSRGGYVYVRSHGEIYQVLPGVPLPGLGRVQAIKRENGAWVVVTSRGLIVANRDRRSFE